MKRRSILQTETEGSKGKGGSQNKLIKPKYFQTLLIAITVSLYILLGSHPEKQKRVGKYFLKRLKRENLHLFLQAALGDTMKTDDENPLRQTCQNIFQYPSS